MESAPSLLVTKLTCLATAAHQLRFFEGWSCRFAVTVIGSLSLASTCYLAAQTLRNNINLNSLPVTANGLHTFSQKMVANDSYDYDVRVLGQPAGQTCVFSGSAAGTATADVTVTVNCSAAPTTYTVGGTVADIPTGMTVTLRLTYGAGNTTEDLPVAWSVAANPVPFDFAAGLSSGDAFAVSVQTQPAGATCTVASGGSGTIGSANVSDVVVTCN